MDAYVGTSGYAYEHWRGGFYPAGIKTDAMLGFFATRFRTVEVNNTYYRIPRRDVVARWAEVVPPEFRFVIKASRRITHFGRLDDVKDSLDYMLQQLDVLGDRLGPILFQTPPTLRLDVERLRKFLSWLPRQREVTFEFRHPSWHVDVVYELLREHDAALTVTDDAPWWDGETIVPTATWGFVRLREGEYDDVALDAWAARIRGLWGRAFVFFKHEESGPGLALRLVARLA